MPTLLLGVECRGGSDWLDERATEALLTRAGVLCHDPTYPVYEKQTFVYDGWRVIQEHEANSDSGELQAGAAVPLIRQFTYGNYLDEALTVDADTDSDGDCLDSGGSTRYYYHQNSLFSVVALSDASANYKQGYRYDPWLRSETMRTDKSSGLLRTEPSRTWARPGEPAKHGRHVRITDGNDADTYVNFGTNDSRYLLTAVTPTGGNSCMFTGQRLDSESGSTP